MRPLRNVESFGLVMLFYIVVLFLIRRENFLREVEISWFGLSRAPKLTNVLKFYADAQFFWGLMEILVFTERV